MSKKKELQRRTMFDFILWYNFISLNYVEQVSGINYTTLNYLIKGRKHSFDYRTLITIADSLGIPLSSFYDWENREHKYFILQM